MLKLCESDLFDLRSVPVRMICYFLYFNQTSFSLTQSPLVGTMQSTSGTGRCPVKIYYVLSYCFP